MSATPQAVDELNRRVRFGCSEHFISWTGVTKLSWFEQGVLPDDAWENTTDGRRALQEMQRYREARDAWEREYQERKLESNS